METAEKIQTSVYQFGNKTAEGNSRMKNLLGGKGANLAEMSLVGIPVPPGFTITTEVCTEFNKLGKEAIVRMIQDDVEKAIANIEDIMGASFGAIENPLLISVRSGARVSMPGMMDTVLNLGLNDEVVKGLAAKTNNERFAWDSYRRFIQMYGGVVLGMKSESKDDIDPFEEIMEHLKEKREIQLDTQFTIQDLKDLVYDFKDAVKKRTGHDFPTNPWDQLWGAVTAVFNSWNGDRAVYYRTMNGY
ncbi:MAG: pyruvate, phosphate dikinase, partial [Croceitalea sp.]|nr:pyruvate, phosphate dikinase [Croceitalea sp.]